MNKVLFKIVCMIPVVLAIGIIYKVMTSSYENIFDKIFIILFTIGIIIVSIFAFSDKNGL